MYILERRYKHVFFLLSAMLFWTQLIFADFQPKIEDYLIDVHRFKLDVDLGYITSSKLLLTRNWVTVTFPDSTVQTVLLTQQIEERQDVFQYGVGLRYGLKPKTEIGFRVTGSKTWIHHYPKDQPDEMQDRISDLTFSINHRLFSEGKYPALFAVLSTTIFENALFIDNGYYSEYAKSGSLGCIAYKSVDPLVLILDFSYNWFLPRSHQSLSFDPVDSLSLKPAVYFSANSDLTLLEGLDIQYQTSSSLASDQGIYVGFLTGLSYALSDQHSFLVSATLKPSSSTQTGIGFKLLTKF